MPSCQSFASGSFSFKILLKGRIHLGHVCLYHLSKGNIAVPEKQSKLEQHLYVTSKRHACCTIKGSMRSGCGTWFMILLMFIATGSVLGCTELCINIYIYIHRIFSMYVYKSIYIYCIYTLYNISIQTYISLHVQYIIILGCWSRQNMFCFTHIPILV